MSNKAPAWVVPVMRFGYAARGCVYAIVGVLTFIAALTGGQTEGTSGNLSDFTSQPLGHAALWVITLGLAAYGMWRLINAWMDLDDYGSGIKGTAARLAMLVTGLIHFGLAFSAGKVAYGLASNGEGKVDDWTASLMQLPYGRALVGVAGGIASGVACYYFYKGISGKYKSRLRRTRTTERLAPVIKAGQISHGIVIALMGAFLIYAAYMSDPSQAGGVGQAFQIVRSVIYGRILLMVLSLGLVSFAIYCWIEACYHTVPSRDGPDIKTLARKADAPR